MTRALLLALALAAPVSALEVPYLGGRVNDQAGMLSPTSASTLADKLAAYEKKTGHQVVLLTLPSLEGDSLEEFSLRVARTWQLGRKGVNDGVLFLVSKNDRKLRIEVGHGLEGAIPDALAGRIVQNEVVPRFRDGDFEGGLIAGVDAIISASDGSYTPAPDMEFERAEVFKNGIGDNFLERLLMSAFVFGILGLFEFIGIVAPGAGWFLYFFLIPFWAAFPMAIWGAKIGMGCLMTHLIGFPMAKSLLPFTSFGKKLRTKGNTTYYGDSVLFTSGGGSSGGGGWSSGGGGGFSGGGGSFGGGGSSGSW